MAEQRQWLAPNCDAVKAPSFLQLWNDDFSQVVRILGRDKYPQQSGFNVGRISPNGRTLAAGSHVGSQVVLLNVKTDKVTATAPDDREYLSDISFATDGQTLASSYVNGTVRCQRLHQAEDEPISFAPHGQLKSRHRLREAGKVLKFSHDGEWLAYGGNGNLLGLWNPTATGQSLKLPHVSATECLTFSPDDKLLATGHTDGIVRLWQLEGAKRLTEFVGHSKSMMRVYFSPNGRTLISTSFDGTSRVWSVDQQCCLGVLDQLILGISPSGRKMVTGYADEVAGLPTAFIQSID
ncbi:MAG: hypothetical protein ABGX16_09665 [Pirellulales bacterium]